MTNYRKHTREHRVNHSTDGRSGVRSYLGHFHAAYVNPELWLHFVPSKEPDRASTLRLDRRDVIELRALCDAYLTETEGN